MNDSSAVPRDCHKTLSFTGTPEEFDARCEKLQAADKRAEKLKWVFVAAAILGGFVGFVGLSSETPPMVGVGLALLLGGMITAWIVGNYDIEDRKLEMARTLVRTFQTELRTGRPVEVNIDFRGYWRYGPAENWLTVKMTLENGVVAQVTARDSCKRKKKVKRKYTKIKDKIVETLVVRFAPPKGQTLASGIQVNARRRGIGSLSLRQTKIAPRAATFVFATGALLRLKGRGGWTNGSYGRMPKGDHAVKALIASYHMLGRAGSKAAAAQG